MHTHESANPSFVPPVTKSESTTRTFQVPSLETAETAEPDIQARLEHANRFGHDLTRSQSSVQRQVEPEAEWEEEEEPVIQTKLTIGQPGDKYEQEADAISAKVMAMPESAVASGEGVKGKGEGGQRQVVPEEEVLQARPQIQARGNAPAVPGGFEGKLAQHKGGGRPLSDETRGFMEPRFGADFGGVRIHETPDLANAIQAQAFTHGQDIYFNAGKYDPGSKDGKELLAHELTHVVQQNRVNNYPKLQSRQNRALSTNNKDDLKAAMSVEKLLRLYATEREVFWIGSFAFQKTWIRGKGQEDVRQEIRRRLRVKRRKGKREQIEYFRGYLEKMSGNDDRKDWLRSIVKKQLEQLNNEAEEENTRDSEISSDGDKEKSIQLDSTDRGKLKDDIRVNGTLAYTAITDAIEFNEEEYKKMQQAKAEASMLFVSLLFSVVMTPLISRGVAALASQLPINASKTSYWITLKAMDSGKTKRALGIAFQVGRKKIQKAITPPNSGDSLTNFSDHLRVTYQEAISQVCSSTNLSSLSDTQLVATYLSFIPKIANVRVYKPIIKRQFSNFMTQVVPIGKKQNTFTTYSPGPYTRKTHKLCWIVSGSKKRLALVEEEILMLHGPTYSLRSWISNDMKELALSKHKHEKLGEVKNLDKKNIVNI